MKHTKYTKLMLALFVVLFSMAFSYALPDYWSGYVFLDGTQQDAGAHEVTAWIDGSLVQSFTLVQNGGYLISIDKSDGLGKQVSFKLKEVSALDTCSLDASEGAQTWVEAEGHYVNLTFDKTIVDGQSAVCAFQCISGNFCSSTGKCGSCPSVSSSGGGGGGGGGGGSLSLNACNDRIDNDGDGKVDYPSDPGCESRYDDDEKDPAQTRTFTIPIGGSNSNSGSTTNQESDDSSGSSNNFNTPTDEDEELPTDGSALTGAVVGTDGGSSSPLWWILIILAIIVLAGLAVWMYSRKK